MLHFLDESHNKGSSKHQETTELLTGEALVLDALGHWQTRSYASEGGDQYGELIISGLVDGKKGSMEEVRDLGRNQKRSKLA